ncbi:MAG: hypothetical protein VKN13_08630 [Cyanobacteriota bacterium]|nr:hypothetical protein [Cyanobacteriota bacterium]
MATFPPCRSLLLGLMATSLCWPQQARAGALRPVLLLMRPQVEHRLARLCVEATSGGRAELAAVLEDPCRKLAGPTSRCLVEETDASGRSLEIMGELMGGRFGADSERVVKRCLERLFGLPTNSLRAVPLQELARRFTAQGGLLPAGRVQSDDARP